LDESDSKFNYNAADNGRDHAERQFTQYYEIAASGVNIFHTFKNDPYPFSEKGHKKSPAGFPAGPRFY